MSAGTLTVGSTTSLLNTGNTTDATTTVSFWPYQYQWPNVWYYQTAAPCPNCGYCPHCGQAKKPKKKGK